MSLDNTVVSEINSIELVKDYYKPIPDHLKSNIRKSIRFKLDAGEERTLENMFEIILPFSKAFFT